MKEHELYETTDATVWAREFCKRWPGIDEHTMLGWFANAIMCGHDHALIANGLSTGSSADRYLLGLVEDE